MGVVVSESVELATILLTDLVGSTRLATSVGPARADELREEHFGLLRQAITSSGGQEVKNLGDGLMVAFGSASGAVSCAVAMQQLFERRYGQAEQGLHVRIGVGAGESTVKDGDYFGMPTVEAARLCAQAPADGILVTELTMTLAGRCEGVEFESVGLLELKGFPEPVEAFSVSWAPLGEEASVAGRWPLPAALRSVPPVSYVGRIDERALIEEATVLARDGARQVVLLSGEPGIGKTRLSSYAAHRAHAEGFAVCWGACSEELAVPYEPWIEVCCQLVEHASQELLARHIERHKGELGRLARNLERRITYLPDPQTSDPETERYLLFSAVAGLLQEVAQIVPVCVVLDDLHWADGQSVALLKHVVRTVERGALQVIATYRDSDLGKDHPLGAVLADLRAVEGVRRIALHGLGADEVAQIMTAVAGHELEEDGLQLAGKIAEETDGNPFFVGEILRGLSESGALIYDEAIGHWRVELSAGITLPESVREVIERRVERLGNEALEVLRHAAVIGRVFDVELLESILDTDAGALLDRLESAVAASLLAESTEQVGRFRFAHALINQTLYEGLGATRRARIHRQIAEALEEQCGDEPGERLGELAGHWAAAVVSSNTAKATYYARRAAERALGQLAPDEAARWYRQALELYDQAPGGDRSERCELLIGLGEAQRQIGNPEHRETLLGAAGLAQELGDAERLCRAVLANSRGWMSNFGGVDSERVQALEAAAGALPNGAPRRAQVLALLACELHYAGEPARCRALAAEAIKIARVAGDPAALAHVLSNAIWAIMTPDTLQERLRLSHELGDLAQRLDDPWLSFWAPARSLIVGLEAGYRAQAESGLEGMRTVAASVPQPVLNCVRLLHESGWALVEGDFQASQQFAIDAYEAGMASGQPDAMRIFGAQLFQIRYSQGLAGELVEQSVRLAGEQDSLSAWRAAAVVALIESGQEDQARELTLTEDFESVPSDDIWSIGMFLWADACSRLRVADRAGELYELLAPFSGQLARTGTVVCSIPWALGTLATTLERYEQAEGHFAAAAEIETRLGAPLFLARTHTGWARALIARGLPEDIERAKQMLEQANHTAARLGAQLITREVEGCRADLAAISG